jgi:TRAP-type uncharacterized transport system substrate-binding protein
MLWEIGLNVASNPDIPYGGNRDMCITIGSGSGEHFTPSLRMATGSAILAKAVAAGELEMAFVNPSGLLSQAYRGTGLFSEPLPVRVVASYPSWDRFVCAFHPRTGLTSLAEVKSQKYPLKVSIREDTTHSTRVLIDQLLTAAGFSLDELVSWGGSLQLIGGPGDPRRLAALKSNQVDAVFDEGIGTWLSTALESGYVPITPEPALLGEMEKMGWRRAVIPAGRYPGLQADHLCIDFSGWPLYASASLPDDVVYDVCKGIYARAEWIHWDDRAFKSVGQVGRDTEETPLDVPLHPGAERWYREHPAET